MFVTHPVKVIVEDLLPAPEIQHPLGDGYHSLPAHDGSLQVPVGILLQAFVVLVLLVGVFRGQFFQPDLKVFVQATLDGIDYGKLVLPSL